MALPAGTIWIGGIACTPDGAVYVEPTGTVSLDALTVVGPLTVTTSTSPTALKVGTTGINTGLSIGYWGTTGYGALWNSALTPSTTNYALLAGANGDTYINAVTGQSIFFRINNSTSGLQLSNTNFWTPTNGSHSLGAATLGWKALFMDYTNTGTVGAVTISKASGRVNIAAAGTSVVVTNTLVTAASHVVAWMSSADATGRVTSVVPAAGSFTITTVAVTAQASFDFLVINAD